MSGYLDDDCGCGNTGHGPGYRYDHRVGPPGSLRAAMTIMLVIGGIAFLFGC